MVVEGVEHDLDVVVAHQRPSRAHLGGDDPPGLAVLAADGDVQRVLGIGHPDLSRLRRRLARARFHLHEVPDARILTPDPLIENAVELDRLGDPDRGRLARVTGAQGRGCRQQERQAQGFHARSGLGRKFHRSFPSTAGRLPQQVLSKRGKPATRTASAGNHGHQLPTNLSRRNSGPVFTPPERGPCREETFRCGSRGWRPGTSA